VFWYHYPKSPGLNKAPDLGWPWLRQPPEAKLTSPVKEYYFSRQQGDSKATDIPFIQLSSQGASLFV